MAGLDHGPAEPAEPECEVTVARNAQYGLWLFALYLAVYGGFVGLSAFAPKVMGAELFGGVNLAIWYGFALIILAFVLALIYGWLCRGLAVGSSHTTGQEPSRTGGGR